MASTINTTNIDTAFPHAGQDNDSQGFRDNFLNTNNNFAAAKTEIEDLQDNVVLKSALSGTVLDNDMSGALLKSAQIQDQRNTVANTGTVGATVAIDVAAAPYQKITTTAPTTLSFINFSTAGTHSVVQVEIDVASTAHTVTLPGPVSIGVDGLQNVLSSLITFLL